MVTDRAPDHIDLTQDELTALLRLSQAIGEHRDREALCAAVVEKIEALLPADRVLFLTPGSRGDVLSIYSLPDAARLWERPHEAAGSLLASVVRDREPVSISSVEQLGETFAATRAMLADEGMQSLLLVPLTPRTDECLGVIGFMSRAAAAWNGCSTRVLEEIGRTVGLALASCLDYQHLQRLDRERKALLEVNAAVGRHLERDELFGALAACLRELLPGERFGIELPIEGGRLQGHLLKARSAGVEPTRPTILPGEGTACNWVLQQRQWMATSAREELRERFPVTFRVMSEEGMESLVAIPLVSGERCRGVLFFMAARRRAYESVRRDFIEQVAAAVAVALDDCLAHEEVRQLRDRLAAENVYLQEEIQQEHNFGAIVGRGAALQRVMAQVENVAPTNTTVLILGETGTGKELVARTIHDRSPRHERPLVKVNCSAISPGLVESELFGHVKGAFTGASAARSGRFELADGGTIFLDEIGELPPEAQAKLLRVLQEREFEPVGSSQTKRVDVRVIAATNRDLEQAVAQGRFRSDLFYRVSVFPVRVPPLRERREDIPLLVQFFVTRSSREVGKSIEGVSRQAMDRLMAYEWPGNVRELQNIIERAVVLARGPVLDIDPDLLRVAPARDDAPSRAAAVTPPAQTSRPPFEPSSPAAVSGDREHASLEEASKAHMLRVLERCGWVIEGPRGAARALGLQPSTLRSRMKKLGLQQRSSRTPV